MFLFHARFRIPCWWLWGWNVGKAPATIASEMLRPKKTKEDAVDSVISLHLHMLRNEVNVVQAKRFMHGHYRATWIWNTNLFLKDNRYDSVWRWPLHPVSWFMILIHFLWAFCLQVLKDLRGYEARFLLFICFFCRSAPSTQAQTQILRELFFHIPDVMFQVTGLQYAFSGSFFSDVNEAQTHAMITIDRFHEFDTFGKGVEHIWQWDNEIQEIKLRWQMTVGVPCYGRPWRCARDFLKRKSKHITLQFCKDKTFGSLWTSKSRDRVSVFKKS